MHFFIRFFITGMAAMCLNTIVWAQDHADRVTLHGNVHPAARPAFDRGRAPLGLSMERMLLVLKPTAQQQADLNQLLKDQQDSSSPEFHHWLTPEEFGQRFGVSQSDLSAVTSWLESEGFQVDAVSAGRNVVEFSGNAGSVRHAFRTEIHEYAVNGVRHWANSTDPEIPASLANIVSGVAQMHNFESHPQLRVFGTAPAATLGNGTHALSPGDYAVIYNANPLLNSGINGSGRTIAVLGRSNINLQDVADFRRMYNLPANAPEVIVNGADPGDLGGGEEMEAVLDNSWSGALAPNANIKFIVSASTNSSDGILLSELYAINNNVADVITESFGSCEASSTQSTANYLSSLSQQAAAQGITYIVSTGDSGSAGCDDPTDGSANGGTSVNILASTPYTTAVGGTQFNEGNSSSFWSASNGAGQVSAQSYIPENVWNQSCASGSCSSANLYAGGGGVSIYFGKPSWQGGVKGVPQDGHRDIPDVSLTAAAAHDPYLLCVQGSCSNGSNSVYLVGGTSASAPSFAGIMALVDQKAGGRQGLANTTLYALAARQNYSNCNGSNASALPSSGCVFNDVTVGNNAVPGEPGYGSSSATYGATTGYDLATGLGSVNVTNLVNQWSNGSTGTSVTYYGLISKESGRVVADSGASLNPGSPMILWEWAKSPEQQWQLVPVDNGYYEVVNRLTGQALDMNGASTAGGAQAIQWPWWGGDNQKWQLVAVDSQYYRLVNKLSGKVLDCAGGSTADGTPLIQWDWWGGPNQEWKLVPVQ